MFWNKFDSMLSKESSVHELLSSGDPEKILLKDLFEKEDCIQETKARNPQLIKVLLRSDIMLQLVSSISHEPPDDTDAKTRFKDATLACEMLNADVSDISDALVQEPGEYLDVLFGLFAPSDALNPILTSFVTRTLGLLISRKPNEVFEYLKSKNNLLDITLKHLNVTAVTDLYIRLITAHESDQFRYQMCEWLNNQKFLERVAAYMDVNFVAEIDYHSNSAQLIADVIRFSREQQLQQLTPEDKVADLTPETYANELLKTADSDDFISLVISILLRCSSCQSSIVQCLAVLGAPFDFIPVNFDGNNEQKILFTELGFRVVNSRIEKYTRILHPVIPQLHDILKNPPIRNSLIAGLAQGDLTLSNRVGQTRVTLVRMFALLISFGRPQLNQAIYENGVLITLLDMFFQYYWNSFFHLHVQNCINLIIRNMPINTGGTIPSDHPLLHQLLIAGRLQQRLMDAWRENTSIQSSGKARRPYMGHLLAICTEILPEQVSKNAMLQSVLTEIEPSVAQEWNDFVANTVKPLIDIQLRCLAGAHPLQAQNQPSPGQNGTADVASFEYSSRAPGEKENENVQTLGIKQIDINPNSEGDGVESQKDNRIVDKTVDEEMRLRDAEEDEDADMEGPIETASLHSRVFQQEPPRPPRAESVGDWPVIQPLNLSEKVGLKRMEEAENSNSPWDVPMKSADESEDIWNSGHAAKPESQSDAWADFSTFNQGPADNVDAFFSTHLTPQGNNSADSEDAPFEFRASCLTPEPNEPNLENAEDDNRPTGDITMNPHSPGILDASPPPVGSGDVGAAVPSITHTVKATDSHHQT